MENNKGKLAKNAVIYSFFTLLQRGLGFFLLPVYTTVLATSELGIISTATAVISFLVILFGLSFRGATTYYYYEYKDEQKDYLKQILGTSVSTILLFTIFGIALLMLTKTWILDRLFENIAFYPYVILSLCSIFLQPIYFFYQSLLKAKQEAKKASFLDFGYFGIMVGLTLIFILGFGFKAEGALLANAIASLWVFIISIIGLRKDIAICLVPDILKKLMKYSLPLMPHNLSGWAMNMVDRIMLNLMDSLSVVALFDVGSQIGKLINIVSLGVNSAFAPWFFDQVKNNANSHENIAKVTNKMVLLYVFLAVGVSWLAPELLTLISAPEYYPSWKVVPLIAMAFVINGFYFSFSSVFFLEKTKYLPILTILGAIVNIILNFLLIKKYGFMGAAYASILTKIFFTAITYLVSQRLYPIPYEINKILVVILIGGMFCFAPYLFQDSLEVFNTGMVVLVKCLILATFGGYVTYKNLNALRVLIKKKNG